MGPRLFVQLVEGDCELGSHGQHRLAHQLLRIVPEALDVVALLVQMLHQRADRPLAPAAAEADVLVRLGLNQA